MNKDDFKKGAKTVTGSSQDGEVWNPTITADGLPKFKGEDSDYKIGNYIAHKIDVGQHKSEIHVFLEAGTGKKFQVWGDKITDEALAAIRNDYGMGVMVCLEFNGREIKKDLREEYEKTPEAARMLKFSWKTDFYKKWTISANPDAPRVKVEGEQFYRSNSNTAPAPAPSIVPPAPATQMPSELPPPVVESSENGGDDLPY